MNYNEVIKTGLKNGITLSEQLSICERSANDTRELERAIINEYVKTV